MTLRRRVSSRACPHRRALRARCRAVVRGDERRAQPDQGASKRRGWLSGGAVVSLVVRRVPAGLLLERIRLDSSREHYLAFSALQGVGMASRKYHRREEVERSRRLRVAAFCARRHECSPSSSSQPRALAGRRTSNFRQPASMTSCGSWRSCSHCARSGWSPRALIGETCLCHRGQKAAPGPLSSSGTGSLSHLLGRDY